MVRAYFPHQPISYTVSFQQLRNPCGANELNCGQTISGSLGATQMHLRTLNIAAGEIVRFIAVSDVRNYLELLDGTGTSVAAAENFLQTTVPTAGRYTLIVRAYFSHQPINFSLSFQQLRNPCGATELNCGQTISGSLGVTQMHLRTLNIAAGEIVRFIAVSDVRNYLELLDATERVLRQPRTFCRRQCRQPAATH